MYNKIVTAYPTGTRRFAQLNTLAGAQQNGILTLTDPEPNGYGTLQFKMRSTEYYSEGQYVWYGNLRTVTTTTDTPYGDLFLTKANGKFEGSLTVDTRNYNLYGMGDGNILIQHIPDVGTQESATCTPLEGDGSSQPSVVLTSITPQEVNERSENCDIRVLVLYSALGRLTETSSAAARVAFNNTVFQNSAIFPNHLRLVLAGVDDIPAGMLNETSGGSTMGGMLGIVIEPLQFPPPAPIIPLTPLQTFVKTKRQDFGADIVVILVDRNSLPPLPLPTPSSPAPGHPLGVAFLDGGSRLALGMVDVASSRTIFCHEVGHLLGGTHERCDAVGANPTPPTCVPVVSPGINRAHTFKPSKKSEIIRKTIMFGAGASQISHYSNPFVEFDGKPTGVVNQADNVSVFRTSSCRIANYNSNFQDKVEVKVEGPNQTCGNVTNGFWAKLQGTLPSSPVSYAWESSTDGVSYTTIAGANTAYYSFSVFPPNQQYMFFLRVTATWGNAQKASTIHYLLVVSCTGNRNNLEEPIAKLEISIAPSPAISFVNVSVYSPTDFAETSLAVLNQYGAVVKNLNNRAIGLGETQFQIDIEGWPSGIYYLVLQVADKTYYQVFSVVKN